MTSETPRETALIAAALDALLQCEPPPRVVAINATGFFVPMPPAVPARDGWLIEGNTSALQLVVSSDLHVVVETWERALREGVAGNLVELLSGPGEEVELYFVDARHRYGVLLGFIAVPGLCGDPSSGGKKTSIRPRVWHSKKDQFAVIIDVDAVVSEILGWSPEEMIGRRSSEFIHPEDMPRAMANWMDMLSAPGAGRRARLRHQHRDGSWIWFEITNYNYLNEPACRCVKSEMVNISDEIAATEALRATQQLRRLTEALPLGVAQIDRAGRIIYRNERLVTLLGNELAPTIEEQLREVVPADRQGLAIALSGLHEGKDGDLEVTLIRDGSARRCSLSLRVLRSEQGTPTGAVVCISDVTESARVREELQSRATYDELTGCHNRASILAVLDQTIQTPPMPESGTAVLFVDLDRFKQINERWGHAVGDEYLRRISRRLLDAARSRDIVGRLGGDEFLVVCQDVATGEEAFANAERIAGVIREVIDIDSIRIEPKASMGVAWTDGGMDSEALVAAADAAMYDSKREGLGRPVLSQPAIAELFSDHYRVEAVLTAGAPDEALHALVEQSLVGLYIIEGGYFRYVNPVFANLFGYDSPADIIDRVALAEVVAAEDRERVADNVNHRTSVTGTDVRYSFIGQRRNGTTWDVEVHGRSFVYQGKPAVIGALIDITERNRAETALIAAKVAEETRAGLVREIAARKRVEEDLLDAAFRDQLTGLPNRSLFVERLEKALTQSRRVGARACAVLLLDCDRFNLINDSFGYMTGDLLLGAIARRLEGVLREGDTLARMGGDEFAVLVDEIEDEPQAAALAERILARMTDAFSLSGAELYLSMSIGVTTSVHDYAFADAMLRDADIAMYRAKACGRHRYEVFRFGLRDRTTRALQLETALRHAIEHDELSVRYQPIVALVEQRITGFEALLRWHHPAFGDVSPTEFIPIAEESGLILSIGEWVMRQACGRLRHWQGTLPAADQLTINVNVSPAQFREIGFLQSVDRALSDTGLPPSCLHIEITETLLVDDLAGVKAILVQLRKRGIKVHIDDFGTGYSSLAYLDQFSVDTLKIDKSFVSGPGDGLASPGIVEMIVKLATLLGVTVTAEGIETIEQQRQLRALSCTNGQGFLFSKAIDADQVSAYLSVWRAEHRDDRAVGAKDGLAEPLTR